MTKPFTFGAVVAALLCGCSVVIPFTGTRVDLYPSTAFDEEVYIPPTAPGGQYLVVNKPHYDAFFLESAVLQTRVKCINLQVTATGSAVSKAMGTAGTISADDPSTWTAAMDSLGGKTLTDPGLLDLAATEVSRLKALVPYMERVPEESARLVSLGQTLAASAEQDFTGWELRKLPVVTKEVAASVKGVGEAGTEAGATLASVPGFLNAWDAFYGNRERIASP